MSYSLLVTDDDDAATLPTHTPRTATQYTSYPIIKTSTASKRSLPIISTYHNNSNDSFSFEAGFFPLAFTCHVLFSADVTVTDEKISNCKKLNKPLENELSFDSSMPIEIAKTTTHTNPPSPQFGCSLV